MVAACRTHPHAMCHLGLDSRRYDAVVDVAVAWPHQLDQSAAANAAQFRVLLADDIVVVVCATWSDTLHDDLHTEQ